jgi:hypothetical protein
MCHNKNIRDMHRGITEFKKGYQPYLCTIWLSIVKVEGCMCRNPCVKHMSLFFILLLGKTACGMRVNVIHLSAIECMWVRWC